MMELLDFFHGVLIGMLVTIIFFLQIIERFAQ
jgi:MFS superfamily sulfate permease-like transporter